jgi:hypothetical protein
MILAWGELASKPFDLRLVLVRFSFRESERVLES